MKRSLTAKLAGMLIGTFLPVNILAVIVCSIIIHQSSNQVQESYQRELDAGMDRLVSDLKNVEDRFSDFLIEYMTELTLAEADNSVEALEMLGDFYDVWGSGGRSGMAYLYDKESRRLYLRYTAGAYEIMQIEEMKSALAERFSEEGTDFAGEGKWVLESWPEGWFLSRQYEYTNYYAGFLLDLEKYLSMLESSPLWGRNQIYLRDGSRNYVFQNDRVCPYTDLGWDEIFAKWYKERNVQWTARDMELQVGIRVVDDEFGVGIPVLYWVLLAVACCSVFLAVSMWHGLKRRVVKALSVMQTGMRELEKEHLDYRIADWDRGESEEFVFLYNSFNHMAEEIALSREKDAKMYQAQLDNLRLQVNPHMLLNSFNMIYSLAQSRNFQCIQEYSLLLVEYFRYALKETDRFVTVEKEMEFVENYVNIQKIRFPGAFTSVHKIETACEEALVPPLLIENFVENAMKYALVPGQTIEVLINIRQEDGRLLISVCDTGRGIKPEILACLQQGQIYRDKMGKGHIGVWNCRRRMEVFYEGKASMHIISAPGQGTQVWLDVPFMKAEQ